MLIFAELINLKNYQKMKKLLPILCFLLVQSVFAQPITVLKNIFPDTFFTSDRFVKMFPSSNKFFFENVSKEEGREIWVSDGTSNGSHLLRDHGPSAPYDHEAKFLLESNGVLYYTTSYIFFNSSISLWKSDTSDFITKQLTFDSLKKISSPISFQGNLFFLASDDYEENETYLWRSDGTLQGTYKIKKIGKSYFDNNKIEIKMVADKFYFNLGLDELWVSDGTTNGTKILHDFDPLNNLSQNTQYFTYNFTSFLGKLFFTAYTPDFGFELWESDGTIAGTKQFKDIYVGIQPSYCSNSTVLDNKMYFSAITSILGQAELWVTDGTIIGTKKINNTPIPWDSYYGAVFKILNNKLLFYKGNFDHKRLCSIDGAGVITVLTDDLLDAPTILLIHQSIVYFTYTDLIPALWKSDGTYDGTTRIMESYEFYQGISQGASVGDIFYFTFPNTSYRGIWQTDGTETGTHFSFDVSKSILGSNPVFSDAINDKILFTENSFSKIWATNGQTNQNEQLDINNYPTNYLPQHFYSIELENEIYFQSEFNEFTKTSGLIGGSQKILPFDNAIYHNVFTWFKNPESGILLNGIATRVDTVNNKLTSALLVFRNNQNYFDTLATFAKNSYFYFYGNLGDKTLFTILANETDLKRSLWMTNGTAIGTKKIIDVFWDEGFARFARWDKNLDLNGKLYFGGVELMVTDGTADGTQEVVDFIPGKIYYGTGPFKITKFKDAIYFSGIKDSMNYQDIDRVLFKTEGNPSDLQPFGTSFKGVFELMNTENNLFFSAYTEENGRELWSTDGTSTSTQMVKDIVSGKESSYPVPLIAVSNFLFFTACDAEHGNELWVTDGTNDGTYLIQDLMPGPRSSNPIGAKVSNGKLFFSAVGENVGREPMVMDLALILNTIDSLNVKQPNKLTVKPNPASDMAVVKLNAEWIGAMEINLIDMQGKTRFTKKIIEVVDNQAIEINISTLESGLYAIVVTGSNGQKITSKLIKQ
jgi:trimeric autotransporter adhesin